MNDFDQLNESDHLFSLLDTKQMKIPQNTYIFVCCGNNKCDKCQKHETLQINFIEKDQIIKYIIETYFTNFKHTRRLFESSFKIYRTHKNTFGKKMHEYAKNKLSKMVTKTHDYENIFKIEKLLNPKCELHELLSYVFHESTHNIFERDDIITELKIMCANIVDKHMHIIKKWYGVKRTKNQMLDILTHEELLEARTWDYILRLNMHSDCEWYSLISHIRALICNTDSTYNPHPNYTQIIFHNFKISYPE